MAGRRIAILGSSVTRDAFPAPRGPELDLVLYYARTSIISLMSRPVQRELPATDGIGAFERKSILRDWQKTFFADLAAARADYLVLDFIDERFPLAFLDGSYFSRTGKFNEVEWPEGFFDGVRLSKKFEPATMALWHESLRRFAARLGEEAPRLRLILNDARLATSWQAAGRLEPYPDATKRWVTRINDMLAQFAGWVRTEFPACTIIEPPASLVVADPTHRWNKRQIQPFHYVPAYYQFLFKAIGEQTSLAPTAAPQTAGPRRLNRADLTAIEKAPQDSVLAEGNRAHRFDSGHLYRAFAALLRDRYGAISGEEAAAIALRLAADFPQSNAACVVAAVSCYGLGRYREAVEYAAIARSRNQFDLFAQKIHRLADRAIRSELPGPDLFADEGDLQGRFCMRPFRHFETTPTGDVFVCCPSWLPVPIGNLFSTSNDDIWNSPTAQELRRSILDGSFRYCSRANCNVISSGSLPARKAEQGEPRPGLEGFGARLEHGPAWLTLSHDRSCNLACPSCRKDFIVAKKAEQDKLDQVIDTLLPLLHDARGMTVTGSGDPLGSAHFYRLLKRLPEADLPKLKVTLHTNGQLLNAKTWSDLALAGRVSTVIVSVDAARGDTYAVVRRGGDFERLLGNLRFVADLRRQQIVQEFYLLFVVQQRNYREMPEFVRLGEALRCDGVCFSMIRNWGTFTATEFRQHWIGDPAHPEYEDFLDLLTAEELASSCVDLGNISPFRAQALARTAGPRPAIEAVA